jgi:parallel beta-helix repeat protein
MKKLIFWTLLALVLAAGLSLTIVMSVGANGGGPNIWYVDGVNGTDDINHGSSNNTGAFRHIQYAIDHVQASDIINVAAGAYDEDLTIEKSLTIQGAGAATTNITGTASHIIEITLGHDNEANPLAETVVFDGFTVHDEDYLINVEEVDNGSSLTISNCIFHTSSYGIRIPGATIDGNSSVNIHHNQFFDNTYGICVVEIKGGSTLDINYDVFFSNTIAAIIIDDIKGGSGVNIGHNQVHDNADGIVFDTVSGGSEINMPYNNIINNTGNGIYIDSIDTNSTVTIGGDSFDDDSNVIGENLGGIYVASCNATLTIMCNYVGGWWGGWSCNGNTLDGIDIGWIKEAGNVLIDNNVIADNGANGISDGSAGCNGLLTITNNIIGAYDYSLTSASGNFDGNTDYGISIFEISETGVVNIENNKIAQNGVSGIDIGCGGQLIGSLTINENLIGAWTDYVQSDGNVYIQKYGGNHDDGIYVLNVTSTGSLTVTNNKIAENGRLGSGGVGAYIATTSGNTTFSGNDIGYWTQAISAVDPGPGTQFDELGPWSVVTVPGTGTISHLGNGAGISISFVPDGQVIIQENNMCKNTGAPLVINHNNSGAGIVNVTDNYVDDNGTGSTGGTFTDIDNAIVTGNTFTRHIEGMTVWYGVCLIDSDNNTISNNNIGLNFIGIYIDENSSNNKILNNNITYNLIDGIIINGDDNLVLGNTISNNQGALLCGINVGEDATGNVIHFNNIVDNTIGYSVGIYNSNDDVVDARWNWWGNISGPYNENSNPGGTGDAVTDNVDYSSWLYAPISGCAGELGGTGIIDGTGATDVWVDIGSGNADVFMSRYAGNPSTSSFGGNFGKFVDVLIDNTTNVTEVEIRVYYTAADVSSIAESTLQLYWWNGTTWVLCSDMGVNTTDIPGPNPYSGYLWAKIRLSTDTNPTIPTLEQLSGTPFGCIGVPPMSLPISDNSPPIISNVLYSFSDNTRTAVDITWTTDELSTSQVKYWASPVIYTPVDNNFVIEHHVHITGLIPNTTYHYQTISIDMWGNTGISDEFTFTTAGQIPTGIFHCTNLSISPGQVSIGEAVTITVSVANVGNVVGSYTITLMINGVAEAIDTVNIAAGSSQSISFNVTKAQAGSYSVSVGGLSGSFVVATGTPSAEPIPPATTPAPTSPGPIVTTVVISAPTSAAPETSVVAPSTQATAPTSTSLSTSWIIVISVVGFIAIAIIFLLVRRAQRIKRIISQ